MPIDPTVRPGQPQPPEETLLGSLTALIGESQALRVDVRTAEQARRKASLYNLGLLTLLVACLALLIVMGYQNTQLTRETKATNASIADCITPVGKCYKQSNARTGKAISDLIRSQVFVSECGRLYPGEAGPAYNVKLEACVAGRLAGQAATPTTPTVSPSPSGR
jgi:adenylosuccinate synthase